MPGPSSGLTILAAGSVSAGQFTALGSFFSSVEVIELGIAPATPLEDARPIINRAIDASPNPWILILRQLESVGPTLAAEIAEAAGERPAAWGYRLRRQVLYGSRPLLVDDGEGEIRLFHRRHSRFDLRTQASEMKVEGPVVRMRNRLQVEIYRSAAEHRAYLAAHGIPHSTLRRVLLFAHAAITSGALFRSPATLQYYWIEAAFDRG